VEAPVRAAEVRAAERARGAAAAVPVSSTEASRKRKRAFSSSR
jgi:hypothetical protein